MRTETHGTYFENETNNFPLKKQFYFFCLRDVAEHWCSLTKILIREVSFSSFFVKCLEWCETSRNVREYKSQKPFWHKLVSFFRTKDFLGREITKSDFLSQGAGSKLGGNDNDHDNADTQCQRESMSRDWERERERGGGEWIHLPYPVAHNLFCCCRRILPLDTRIPLWNRCTFNATGGTENQGKRAKLCVLTSSPA